jgi:hypothetical protein
MRALIESAAVLSWWKRLNFPSKSEFMHFSRPSKGKSCASHFPTHLSPFYKAQGSQAIVLENSRSTTRKPWKLLGDIHGKDKLIFAQQLEVSCGSDHRPAVSHRTYSSTSHAFDLPDQEDEDIDHDRYTISHVAGRKDDHSPEFVHKHTDIKNEGSIRALTILCLEQSKKMGRERIAQGLRRLEALWGACEHDGEEYEAQAVLAANTLFARAKQEALGMRPKQLCMVLSAHVNISKKYDARLIRCLEQSAIRNMENFKPHHVVLMLRSLARMRRGAPAELVRALTVQIMCKVNELTSLGVASVMWSLATLKVVPEQEVVVCLEGQALARAHEWQGHDIATVVWALSKLHVRPSKQLIEEVAVRIARGTLCMRARDTGMVLQSLAKTRFDLDDEVLGLLMEDIASKAPQLDAQGVANTLWALAQLGCGDMADSIVMHTLCRRGRGLVQNMSGQEVTISLWALAKMGYGVSDFDARGSSGTRGDDYEGYDEDQAVWAIGGGADNSIDRLIDALSARAGQRAAELDAQAVSNAMWAFATFGTCPQGLVVHKISARVQQVAGAMTCQGVSNVLWSLARLDLHPDVALLNTLCHRAETLVQHAPPQALVNMLWAFGKLRFRPSQDLLTLLQKRVRQLSLSLSLCLSYLFVCTYMSSRFMQSYLSFLT